MINYVPTTYMGEEKTSGGIMRIGIGLTVLVMDTMISRPNVDWILHCQAVSDSQEDSKW